MNLIYQRQSFGEESNIDINNRTEHRHKGEKFITSSAVSPISSNSVQDEIIMINNDKPYKKDKPINTSILDDDDETSVLFNCREKKIKEVTRKRHNTIDYHSLPSLFWRGPVKEYHEKTFNHSEYVADSEKELINDIGFGQKRQDGLSLILER